MDSPENSSDQGRHVHEVAGTGSVWWNMDGLDTPTGTGAEKTHGARGSDCFGSAKGFGGLSLGTHTKGTPAKGSGDHKLSDGVHAGH